MVYKRLDPAADWDAYCDDHPDMPEQEQVPEEFWTYECTGCGTVGYEDVEHVASYAHLPDVYKCVLCGAAAYNEGEYDTEAFMEWCKQQKQDAEEEAAYERYCDSRRG